MADGGATAVRRIGRVDRNVIDDFLVMTTRLIPDADRFTSPVAGQRRSRLGADNIERERETDAYACVTTDICAAVFHVSNCSQVRHWF